MYQQNLFNTITTGMGYPTRFRMLPVLLLSDPIPSLSFLKWKLPKNVVFPSRKPQVLTITITKIKKYERTYRFLISALGSSSGLCPYVWSTELGVLTSKSWPLIPENKEEKFLWHWMKRHWTKQQSLHSTNTYSSYTDAIKSIFTSNSHGCCKTWTMGDTAQTIHALKTCLEWFFWEDFTSKSFRENRDGVFKKEQYHYYWTGTWSCNHLFSDSPFFTQSCVSSPRPATTGTCLATVQIIS